MERDGIREERNNSEVRNEEIVKDEKVKKEKVKDEGGGKRKMRRIKVVKEGSMGCGNQKKHHYKMKGKKKAIGQNL